jgi:hypothetical protein
MVDFVSLNQYCGSGSGRLGPDPNPGLKEIVSREWARLQMGSLDRSEFRTIPLEVYF